VAAEARDAVLARAAVVAVETDARVEADDVADVAVEARCRLELLASEAGTRSDRELGHADAAAGDDDHAAAAGQREPEVRAALQVGHDVRNRLALEALGVRGHGVGATGYEAGRGESAIRAGSDRPRRAGARVGDGHRCPRNRVARFVGNGAVDPGRDLLRGSRCGQDGDDGQRKRAGGEEILELHGWGPLSDSRTTVALETIRDRTRTNL